MITPHNVPVGLPGPRHHDPPTRTSGAVFGPTKIHQTRTVPVPLTLETYARGRIGSEPSRSYLFPSPTGAIWTNWTETTKSVGLAGTTIHDLRHTAASLLIAAGADVKAVQMILGHATATTTMDLYGHLLSEAPVRGDGADADVPGTRFLVTG